MDLRDAKVKRKESPLPKNDMPDAPVFKASQLEAPKMRRHHGRLLSMYQQELDRQQENRMDMATDEAFYDGEQWQQKDIDTLKERGQMALVYDVISNSVNWVIGSEKRGRIDFKILPRRKEDGMPAQRKTELLKYLSDVNRTPFHRSRAFEDTVKVGLGWLEDGCDDGDDGEPVYSRYESWRNMLWDSAATELDLSDARYIFRSKWVDLDFAQAMFPGRAQMLKESAQDALRFGVSDIENGDDPMDSSEQERETVGFSTTNHLYQRERVRMIEAWFRHPVTVKRLRGGDFNGDVYDENSPAHEDQLQSGKAVLIEKVMARMHCAILTTKGLCYFGQTPYRHNSFPFTPIWAYRRGRDGLPYGMIRKLRDIQADINKRASKALAILSSNKVLIEEGSVDDIDEFAEEASRPDAVLVYKLGKQKPELNADRDLAAGHLQLFTMGMSMIQQASGVTDELMGRKTNASSGIAIQARQDQGSLATSKFFDNLRLANQIQGEKQLSLMEQYFSEQKAFRITNQRGTPEYVTINDGLPENDIIRTKADFVISEQEWRASVRQSQVDQLMEMMMKLAPGAPQLVMVMLDLVVEGMDIPSREEIVKRIRQVTGMKDPDQTEPTQEDIIKAQEQQRKAQIEDAMVNAELGIKQATAAKTAAQAQQIGVQNTLTQSQATASNVTAQNTAMDAALKVIAAPVAAPIADTLLNEAGFISRTEQESNMAQAARTQEAEMQHQQEQQAIAQQQAQAQQQEQQQSQQQQPGNPAQQAGIGQMPPPQQ